MTRVKKPTVERTDREKLELFLRKVEELSERSLAKKGINTSLGYTANRTSGFNMSLIEPEEEEIYAFLPIFRQFISDKEPVFLSRIYKICLRRLVDDELKQLVADSREIWGKTRAFREI